MFGVGLRPVLRANRARYVGVEKQNKEQGIEDKSDGEGLTLDNQKEDSKTRELLEQGDLTFFLICRP